MSIPYAQMQIPLIEDVLPTGLV